MARIVITCWGSYGDLYPYIGLGKALQTRGHHVTLGVPSFYHPHVEQAGLAACTVGPEVDPNDRALIARVMDPAKGAEVIIREWLMPAVRDSYRQLETAVRGADVLVSHPVTFAAPVLAERLDLPWVSTVLAPMSFFSAYDLPVMPNAESLVHLNRLGLWFTRAIVRLVHRAARPWATPVDALRAELGLPHGRNPVFEGQFSPALTLALFSKLLATPQPDWPANVEVTGFVFYNGPESLSAELCDFLDAGAPPVVFTLGSSAVGAAGTFYQESAIAAARLGVRAVLLTGGLPENDPGPLSRDIIAVDRAPHQLLFPRAAAIVHQGGVGTTGQALRAGRPALVVPHAHDQPDNAHRVRALGVARVLRPARYRAPRVAGEIDRLLNDQGYRQACARVAPIVAAEGGAAAAAASLDRWLRPTS